MAQQNSAKPALGTRYPTARKLFEETIFFVHFYAGSQKALQRHIEWVNGLGFDAYAFDLETPASILDFAVTSGLNIGWKHFYADQIEQHLNQVSGKKIVYAFSNPAAAAIEAMARRHCNDTVALVCDSGPSGKFIFSVANLLQRDKNYSRVRSLVTAGLKSIQWSPTLRYDISAELASFPEGFPVLSIRGWKDNVIPPDHIDAVFEPHPNLDWRKLALPEAEHLNGLKNFPKDYEPLVKKFLLEVASAKKVSPKKKVPRMSAPGKSKTY